MARLTETAPLAAIDVGSNTLRLLIGSVSGEGVKKLFMDRSVTRLGAGLARTGIIDDNNIGISVASLARFKAACDVYGVRRIVAVGTSALREAENSDLFIRKVEMTTGIRIRVISGDEEADLTVKGVTGGMKNPGVGSICRLIIDIGGGSTEWILADGNITRGSVPVGAVKLTEAFLLNDPPFPDELERLRHHAHEALSPVLHAKEVFLKSRRREGRKDPPDLILTGGTPTTLAAMDLGLGAYDGQKVHLHQLSISALDRMLQMLAGVPLTDRKCIPGLAPERADIIIAGAALFRALMDVACQEVATVSDHGLLEGALLCLSDLQHSPN